MVKVITYGTYDLLHYGHIRLLERAKALGDYLIVGITSDDYDKSRGKINNQQSLIERIAAVKATGLADEIIVEEYEGQKIDDIRRYNVDIFTVGSDWVGKFDYLNEFCKVIYLPRTEGVSSSQIRAEKRKLLIGAIGNGSVRRKFVREMAYVNGVEYKDCDDDTVECKPAELCPADKGDHGLAGEETGKESSDETSDEAGWAEPSAKGCFTGDCLQDVEELLAKDWYEYHQE